MSSSYAISQSLNFQSVLWAVSPARAWLPALWAMVQVFALALLLTAVIAGAVFLAVACWVVLAKVAFGLGIVALFGWVTYPRSKAVRK